MSRRGSFPLMRNQKIKLIKRVPFLLSSRNEWTAPPPPERRELGRGKIESPPFPFSVLLSGQKRILFPLMIF